MLSELDGRALGIGLVLLRHPGVLEGDLESALNPRSLGLGLPFQKRAGLVEDPGLAERSPRDHNRRAARLPLEPYRVLGGLDVAVPDHRYVQGLRDRRDLLPTGVTAVHLRPRAWVEGKGPRPSVLATESDLHRITLLLAPAAPNLDGNWKMGTRGD